MQQNITYDTNTTQNTAITVPRIYTKTVTVVTKLLGTFLVILTLTIQEDVTTLSPFFKAEVSFTINIPIILGQLLPCEDNSLLLEYLIYYM